MPLSLSQVSSFASWSTFPVNMTLLGLFTRPTATFSDSSDSYNRSRYGIVYSFERPTAIIVSPWTCRMSWAENWPLQYAILIAKWEDKTPEAYAAATSPEEWLRTSKGTTSKLRRRSTRASWRHVVSGWLYSGYQYLSQLFLIWCPKVTLDSPVVADNGLIEWVSPGRWDTREDDGPCRGTELLGQWKQMPFLLRLLRLLLEQRVRFLCLLKKQRWSFSIWNGSSWHPKVYEYTPNHLNLQLWCLDNFCSP